jgi:hypothetical protein
MRRALIAASIALLAGCSQGEIKGTVVVGPTAPNFVVFVGLWSVSAQPSVASNPNSPLVPKNDGSQPSPLGSAAFGTTTSSGGSFQFSFPGLGRGLYFVGAYLDTVDDQNPDILTLTHTVDSASLLEIDPANKSKQVVVHDLFVAESAPGTGTIRGTLHRSPGAAALNNLIWALNGRLLSSSTATVLEQQGVPGTDATVSYALFNLPLQPTYVFANADVAGDGNLNNDLLAFPVNSPVPLSATQTEADGVDLWLDTQNPVLGSISGQLTLNAPLPPGTTANVQLYAQAGGYDALSPTVALLNIPVTGSSAAFTLKSVPPGSIYVSSGTQVTLGGAHLFGSNYYPGPPQLPQPITVSASNLNPSGIVMPVGLGEVRGTVTLQSVPPGIGAVWVIASIMDGMNPFVVAGTEIALTGTSSPAPFAYTLFGLTNGPYEIQLIPASTAGTDLGTALQGAKTYYSGSPANVTIEGNVQTSDFTVSL